MAGGEDVWRLDGKISINMDLAMSGLTTATDLLPLVGTHRGLETLAGGPWHINGVQVSTCTIAHKLSIGGLCTSSRS